MADEAAWRAGKRVGDAPGAAAGSGGRPLLPPIMYEDSYCVQAQLLTRALVSGLGPVVECLMRGKWHAKIGLSKILYKTVGADDGKSRIDLVTERMFDDAVALAAAGLVGASGDLDVVAAGATWRLPRGDSRVAGLGLAPTHGWVPASRQMGADGAGGIYPDPLAQNMCVLAPPIARKELWNALRIMLREFLARDLAALPAESGSFSTDVLPLLHCACNAPGGAYRVLPEAPVERGDMPPPAAVFGAAAWAHATAGLLNAYRAAPPGSEARRAAVHANRLSWLLGALAFLNATVSDDWGVAHERLDAYSAAFRAEYLSQFLGQTAQ